MLQAIQTSLQYLDGRIDLMLMHAPGEPSLRADTWRALEEAKAEVRCSITSQGGQPQLDKRSLRSDVTVRDSQCLPGCHMFRGLLLAL